MEHLEIPLGERHAPHNWEFADATARSAEVVTDAALLGVLALQLDDGSYWRLSAVAPAGWVLGPKGDKGETGDMGATGAAGAQGTPGAAGETGPQGIQGEVGPTGPVNGSASPYAAQSSSYQFGAL